MAASRKRAPDAKPLISFRGVQKSFGPKRIYAHLDLDVYEGETLVILGGSGVGKSVMLKMLVGLLTADAGTISFDGASLRELDEAGFAKVHQQIAMLFQGAALFDSLSVGENVAYALNEHHFRTMAPAEIKKRVAWALALVGLPGIEDMKPSDLSGGMRKRVGLARAIALQPRVLLYDEPTTGLDPINSERISHLVTGMQEELAVTSMVVTHDMKGAFSMGDRLAMVHKGRIILAGTPDEVRASTDPRVKDFIEGNAPKAESLESLMQG